MKPRDLKLTSLPRKMSIVLAVAVAAAAVVATSSPPARGEDEGNYAMIGLGRGLYRSYCGSCHGATAQGDGSLAKSLRVKPSNLTMITHKNGGTFPFEQVAQKIDGRTPVAGHGSSDMPVWGQVFTKNSPEGPEEVQKKVEALAHYLRSIQVAGEPSR